jgi:glycosyltransferase involved in cell wall biosynthesis
VRVLIDYRPALRERSGVGEYTHELVRALLAAKAASDGVAVPAVTLFSSSLRDRVAFAPELAGATIVDRRIPVAALNLAWHRVGWPPAEWLAGVDVDVTHSLHPLLMPSRRAAQVITIHDLNFLQHPERTRAEIRRDYPRLARRHAQRADRVIAVSEFTAGEIVRLLDVPIDRISVCSPGRPHWQPRAQQPVPGYVLFFGTLEPRKNVGALLDAYERLLSRGHALPELLLAGKETATSAGWLERLTQAPLRGRVRHIGYVRPADRLALYEGARLLVQPSFEEGFGIPVLEAMTLGVPVIAANRGALPEVLGGAGLLIDPEEPDTIAAALLQLLENPAALSRCVASGIARSRAYDWTRTAKGVMSAYQQAIDAHRR